VWNVVELSIRALLCQGLRNNSAATFDVPAEAALTRVQNQIVVLLKRLHFEPGQMLLGRHVFTQSIYFAIQHTSRAAARRSTED
jgi:hypothetical protein